MLCSGVPLSLCGIGKEKKSCNFKDKNQPLTWAWEGSLLAQQQDVQGKQRSRPSPELMPWHACAQHRHQAHTRTHGHGHACHGNRHKQIHKAPHADTHTQPSTHGRTRMPPCAFRNQVGGRLCSPRVTPRGSHRQGPGLSAPAGPGGPFSGGEIPPQMAFSGPSNIPGSAERLIPQRLPGAPFHEPR